jgi:pimeloyl-ACP methyl ester carboxylesterase
MINNPLFKSIEGQKQVMKQYDDILSLWPVPYKTKFVSTKYGETHVILSGKTNSTPLVLIHGAGSNSVSWLGEVAEYSKKYYVVAIDVIGEPGRSAPTRPSWESNAYAEWLLEVIKKLKLKKINLLGISQGGWIALKFATVYPNIVNKLVLISPAGIVPTKLSFLLIAIFFTLFGKWGNNKLNKYVLSGQAMSTEVLKYMDTIMTNFKPRFDKEYIFTDKELKRLIMPVLLIGGNKDVIRSIDLMLKRVKNLVPSALVVVVPNAGHVLMNTSDQTIAFFTR